MRDITIKNFRCYEETHIEFRSGINLLIGDNSSGKTSLLRACNFVMNSFFSGYSDENTTWKSADDDDFRSTGINEMPIDITFHVGEWDFMPIQLPSDEWVRLNIEDDLKIEKKSKKNSRYLVTGLKPLKDYASKLQQYSHTKEKETIVQKTALPIYACFTTEDIHSTRKFDKKIFNNYVHKPSFGYFESHDCRGLLDYWIKRLLVLKEAKKGEIEINCVRKAISDALGQNGCNIINDMDIRHNDGKVYFHFTDGRESETSQLSDGYRRLVNIVIDIAIRCALLNKELYGDDAYKQTHGTVIIDEIDEHLHPALQVCILKALHDTFPKIQFIVSTHAPLVMSSVEPKEENVIYRLEYSEEDSKYIHYPIQTYGLDANLILEESMNVGSRDPKVMDLINTVRESILKKEIEAAKERLSELGTITDPNQPELVKLRAMINRLEIIGR